MRAKVYLITGFLGSGKTTLLKRILKSANDLSSTIVLVNEFGKVGVDRSMIKETAAADIVELTSGCICCSIKTDMIQTLQILKAKYAPERVVIEATGVADPLSIIEVLKDRILAPAFCMEKVITVVAGDFWEAREAFGSVFKSQLKHADLVLFNKIDTLDRSQIPIVLQQVQDECEKGSVIPTLYGNIDPQILWADIPKEESGIDSVSVSTHDSKFGFKAYDPKTDLYSHLNGQGSTTARDAGFVTFSFETSRTMDENRFQAFLDTIPLELFRIKGPVRFADQTKMLNFVGGKSEWIKWTSKTKTCLAFIGWDVVGEQILERLDPCIVRV